MLKIFDTSKRWNPDCEPQEIPIIKMKPNANELFEGTKVLLKQLKHEFLHYFPKPDGDQIVAMHLHPVMVSYGLR